MVDIEVNNINDIYKILKRQKCVLTIDIDRGRIEFEDDNGEWFMVEKGDFLVFDNSHDLIYIKKKVSR